MVWAALDPSLQGADILCSPSITSRLTSETDQSGAYLYDCQIQEAQEYATDEQIAERLWVLSREMVGIKDPIERRPLESL